MRDYDKEKAEYASQIELKLQNMFGRTSKTASGSQLYKAVAMVTRDQLMSLWAYSNERIHESPGKQLYFLSMEFLPGRTLVNNLVSLGLEDVMHDAVAELGHDLEEIKEYEPDAGLGNGGLGRLGACFMDSLSTLGFVAHGMGIRYEYGLFKQRIVDGYQVEMADSWLEDGSCWEVAVPEEAVTVRFGGYVEEVEEDGQLILKHKGYQTVNAIPYDMPILGYQSSVVNHLRLWGARATEVLDMDLFGAGRYMDALQQKELAEVISKVLYPEDNHPAGKLLRLRQQYFFVSASIQNIVNRFRALNLPFSSFPDYTVIHVNDTHPALAIPELMRILLDEEELGWDEAWSIVTRTFAYTNHTVLEEALERWPVEVVRRELPRLFSIIHEINEKFCQDLWKRYPGQWDTIANMAIIAHGEIKMAHLCIVAAFSVNGVAQLHADILKEQVFSQFYEVFPKKFRGITNGVTFRRFLLKSNPDLAALISESIGGRWVLHPEKLEDLLPFAEDKQVQQRLADVRYENKVKLAEHIQQDARIKVDPESIFDVQIKRLHEYKRQLLNVLHIMYLYNRIRKNPDEEIYPRTFIFGAKAAPGYRMAKLIIKLIHCVGNVVNNDPRIQDRLKVVFLENYRVSLAEKIIPATDVSEQISSAGKEASGTGNMKFMLNGALTVGTLDGANVEIEEQVGPENIYIFGLTAEETARYYSEGNYDPYAIYQQDEELRECIDQLVNGFFAEDSELFQEIYDGLLYGRGGMADPYFILKDFAAYRDAQHRIDQDYRTPNLWWKKALVNIASAGLFSSDRTIREYNRYIWRLPQQDFSTYDLLTGLYNHQYMVSLLDRQQVPFSIIAFDIDDYRELNARHGYVAGDDLLLHVSKVIHEVIRKHDTVGRYQEGEFLVILPGAQADSALQLAQAIRAKLAEMPYRHEDETIAFTLSMGVHTVNTTWDLEDVLKRVEQAMRTSKRNGKNRIEVAADDAAADEQVQSDVSG